MGRKRVSKHSHNIAKNLTKLCIDLFIPVNLRCNFQTKFSILEQSLKQYCWNLVFGNTQTFQQPSVKKCTMTFVLGLCNSLQYIIYFAIFSCFRNKTFFEKKNSKTSFILALLCSESMPNTFLWDSTPTLILSWDYRKGYYYLELGGSNRLFCLVF